jgi:hypothetical protein
MHSEEPMSKPPITMHEIEQKIYDFECAALQLEWTETKEAEEDLEAERIRLIGMIDGYAKQCALEAEARTRDELLRRSV